MDDKFLTQAEEHTKQQSKGQSQTYGQMRLKALKESEEKNMANRLKSKKQREREGLEQGLERNLIDEATKVNDDKDNDKDNSGEGNKALSMMLKMGFKPGQSLGKRPNDNENNVNDDNNNDNDKTVKKSKLIEPIKPYFLQGKSGIGIQRVISSKEIAEAAKLSNNLNETQQDFRIRKTYEAKCRKSEGVLKQLRNTIKNLDEDNGMKVSITYLRYEIKHYLLHNIKFNVFWINPYDIESYPSFLLSEDVQPSINTDQQSQSQLIKDKMNADKLHDINEDDNENDDNFNDKEIDNTDINDELIQQCKDFIRIDSPTRLKFTLEYAREAYFYCFWW